MKAPQFLIALNQLVNTIWRGKARETISGTVGRAQLHGEAWAALAAWLIEALPVFRKGHCLRQAAKEQVRRDAERATL